MDIRMFAVGHTYVPLDLTDIGKYRDWADVEAKTLSNTLRWAGAFDKSEGAISVARHCCLVAEVVSSLSGDPELAYAALHHEIEEAFGVGDICYDVKKFIFKDNKRNYT